MAVAAAEKAVRCLGRGFDMTCDMRLKFCKDAGGCIVERSGLETAPLGVPGVGTVVGVPVDVKCGKGDRVRFKSGVLEFNKMSELFSQRSSVEGKIPSGLFNASFDLDSGSWAQDAPATKCLAMDGYFISLFDLRLDRRPLALADHVLRDVPAAWDPSAIARFIEKYGTHVIVGLSMGGQDVVCVKQDRSSPLSPSEIKEHLDRLGDQLFTGACPVPPLHCKSKDKFKIPEAFNVFDAQVAQQRLQAGITTLVSSKEGVTVIYSKRGGDTTVGSHSEWLLTVPATPDVINVKAVPITSLIRGVAGAGYLSHAINLYLRYKPPVADLKYFLDFQHHKMWAPVLGELPLGPCSHRQGTSPALHFSLLGSKLYVSSSEVIVPTLPVTGMRLHLEGKKNNRLAVHLQHLSATPTFIAARADKPPVWRGSEAASDDRYYEPVQWRWRMFARVCTAPVKYEPRWCGDRRAACIVTGAQLHVAAHDSTDVLHLRLLYSELPGCAVVQSRWARGTTRLSGKSSFLSVSSAGSSGGGGGTQKDRQRPGSPAGVNIDSGVLAGGPPVPVAAQKMLRFVDTSQVTMGPQDSPGYWLITGARLDVDKGRISLHVKFSLLTPVS
ncbi:MACPF domain-containing protein At1g14780-like isoform X2 [Phragmites australis]|uniref:MACPF domain-containing protein At1g14780-like isoform X2 n=1 Tax=Phragmites australis TaxID=29695 RepID=UPI002D790835|nr:MACPF domain-containing protein At1g14780-like isoform X2 [Phragmites australis]